MPWMETNEVKERLAFVRDLESGHWSITELCERYGVTRPTDRAARGREPPRHRIRHGYARPPVVSGATITVRRWVFSSSGVTHGRVF
jgi:hypothetical protein